MPKHGFFLHRYACSVRCGMHKSECNTKFRSQMTDFQQSDLNLPSIKALLCSNIPIHDMQHILSCFHMDGTGNGGNNDKSVWAGNVLPVLPPLQSASCSLAPQPCGPKRRSSMKRLTGVITVGCIFALKHISV